jgi:hypothetical protein
VRETEAEEIHKRGSKEKRSRGEKRHEQSMTKRQRRRKHGRSREETKEEEGNGDEQCKLSEKKTNLLQSLCTSSLCHLRRFLTPS